MGGAVEKCCDNEGPPDLRIEKAPMRRQNKEM